MSQWQHDEVLAREVARWRAEHQDRLAPGEAGGDTLSGIPVAPLYTALDAPSAGPDGLATVGLPGEPPYTRGVAPGGYREGLWVMGLYSGRATPKETNARIRSLLAQGQRGFSIALDLPTQNGLDSDHPLSQGEVGRVGVPVDSLADMVDLLDGIALDEVAQIRTTANAIGPIAIALFIAAAEEHGYSPADFRVLLQNDVLKEYLARGTYVFPPRPAVGFSVDVMEYCARHLPHWKPIEFCGYHIRDAGSTAVQEVAIALANGIEYLDAAIGRGLSVDDVAPTIYLFLSSHLDLFEEVAKFRAARRMWHRLMTERYGAQRPESARLNIFCYTLGSPQTAQEPHNNVVRIAYQALAAVLGGVQTLATSSFDEALGLPSDEAVRISLRTQQILAYETGVARTPDPLGGSYLVERLTDQFEEAAWAYLGRIDAQGGALRALESGWLAAEVDEEAYRQQRAIDDGRRTVVGVNRFQSDAPSAAPSPPSVGTEGERDQLERLAAVRRRRDGARVDRTLAALGDAAAAGENTIPTLVDAVRAYATVGEICDVLAKHWGRYVARDPGAR
ncbi:MAG TPA: methylmalonyl-CoA mutase family protein [Acidimicrobiales bacterium]|nr:methylmalonyl-CoA mutase family protein [Acidimicrobiales bacterium]